MDIGRLGADIRHARVGAGLSLRRVGEVAGISGAQISRIERGLSPSTSVVQLVRLGAVVGLDVRIHAYPGGDPLRDTGHVQVIERFRMRLATTVGVRLEVPLPIQGDRRAWDLFLDRLLDRDGRLIGMPAEVETRISDAQAQIRKIWLKMRDSSMDAVIVVVADTPTNRRAIAAARSTVAGMFPVTARTALAALAEGRHPGGSCLLFI
jgi:transcriptional regulator with XRE-family HTH domain